MTLLNKDPSKEEIGKYLGDILMYENLRDKFVGIKDELAELGFGRIEVHSKFFNRKYSLKLMFRFLTMLSGLSKKMISQEIWSMSQENLR